MRRLFVVITGLVGNVPVKLDEIAPCAEVKPDVLTSRPKARPSHPTTVRAAVRTVSDRRVHRRANSNGDVQRREGTSTGGGGDLVGGDEVTDLLEVAGGEDESNVALDVGKEPLELGVLGEDSTESTADHGVLAHHDDTLATEGNTNLMHLV